MGVHTSDGVGKECIAFEALVAAQRFAILQRRPTAITGKKEIITIHYLL
jgi:hypothetical protein